MNARVRAWLCVSLFALAGIAACHRALPEHRTAAGSRAATSAAPFAPPASAVPEPTSLFRSSIEVTGLRLQTLFPKLDVEALVLGTAPSSRAPDQTIASTINALDRPTGAIAQVGLRKLIVPFCQSKDPAQNRVFQEQGLLMSGESWPGEPANRAALAAARNVFLYPYAADAPEVAALATAYHKVMESGGNVDEARQVVCVAALLAPQFWLGNGGDLDFVRKVSLEVGRRIPSFAEYQEVLAGRLTKEAFVQRVQAEPGYLTAVRAWHRDWLGLENVGTLEMPSPGRAGRFGYPRGRYRASDSGALGMAGADISTQHRELLRKDGGLSQVVLASQYIHEGQRAPAVEACDGAHPFEQDFDPTTSKILWEIWNPLVQRWEQIGAQVATRDWLCESRDFRIAAGTDAAGARVCAHWKDGKILARFEHERWLCQGGEGETVAAVQGVDGSFTCGGKSPGNALRIWLGRSWKMAPGSISLPNHKSLEVTPEDITGIRSVGWGQKFTAAEVPDPEAGLTRARYQFSEWSKFSGTPLQFFADRSLRARRFDGHGQEQNGFSAVRLYWSGQTVYVCNAFMRSEATCSYRPPPALYHMIPGPGQGENWNARLTESTAFDRFSPGVWKAGFYLPIMNWAGFGFYSIGKASGWVMDNFSCGIPNLTEYEKGPPRMGPGGTPPNPGSFAREEVAFPKTPPYNDFAFNVWQTRLDEQSKDEPEIRAQMTLVADVNEEPYRLIEHIVRGGGDYRQLLTAPYTFGSPAYELLLRSQGFFLPRLPPGEYAKPGEPAFDLTAVRRIQSLPARSADDSAGPYFASFSREWLRSSLGYERGAFATHDQSKLLFEDYPNHQPFLKDVSPRPMSGILTMATFLEGLGPKTRSLSAALFSRFLCTDPSGIALSPEEESVQYRYASKNPEHLDRAKGCYQCHLNLDPFGKALNNMFLKPGTPGAHDDLEPPHGEPGGELHGIWGIRGSSDPGLVGEGAFKGKVVRGVRELAQAIADSPEFNACVVRRHFEALYGRHPTFADAGTLKSASDAFMQHHDYNRMMRSLVLSPTYVAGN